MLNYVVEENLLTNPHTYKCRVTPNEQLDYDAVAELISVRNPSISKPLAKVVLEEFASVVMDQLLAGNWIVLKNFVSFMSSMPVSLSTPDETLPGSVARMKVKTSTPFKDAFLSDATYNRTGYPVKLPTITDVKDSVTGISGFAESGKSATILGRNIGYDPSDSSSGLYVKNYDGSVTTKQSVVNLNDPSKLMVTFDSPITDGYPEMTIESRNKFTENGTLRTSTFGKKLRGPVDIASGNLNLLFSVGSTSSLTTISNYSGSSLRVQFSLWLSPQDELYIKLRTISSSGELGPWTASVLVTGDGDYEFAEYGSDLTVTFATGGYDIVVSNVIAYGRVMNEVCDLTSFA